MGHIYSMNGADFRNVRSGLINRHVGIVFGILLSFLIILQLIFTLGLDPFANVVVQILVIPGWIVMTGYIILQINVLPDMG